MHPVHVKFTDIFIKGREKKKKKWKDIQKEVNKCQNRNKQINMSMDRGVSLITMSSKVRIKIYTCVHYQSMC